MPIAPVGLPRSPAAVNASPQTEPPTIVDDDNSASWPDVDKTYLTQSSIRPLRGVELENQTNVRNAPPGHRVIDFGD